MTHVGMLVRRSLTRHLMAWAMGALLIVWASFMFMGYETGLHEADELTDGHLAGVASLLLAEQEGRFAQRSDPAKLAGQTELKNHDYQQSMSVVIWDATGMLMTSTGQAPIPPFTQAEGFETLNLGNPPTAWRTFARWDGEQHRRKVMVLLSVSERDDLAQDIAEQIAEPGWWLLPVVALALGLAIRRGLRPLYALSSDVHALDIHQPAPLRNAHPQEEFRAVVDSINTLAERYQGAMARERELANELAHELRTPLASLTLQARVAAEAPPGPERDAALAQIGRDSLRAGQVLADLLALARASRAELAEAAQPLDLDAIARDVVGSFAQAAHASGHELALDSTGPFPLDGHSVLLELALRNLLENALAHTPAGTQVEVRLDPVARWIEVADDAAVTTAAAARTGPGAGGATGVGASALGLGLGHRVVAKVAAIHGATFERLPGDARGGSRYRIQFPA